MVCACLVLVFGILHKYESQLKQDTRYVADKIKETYDPLNNKTVVKGRVGMTEAISALALLSVVAFIFNQR